MFTYVILLGTLVSALFTNDGTALILTPIVLAQVRALKLDGGMVLAFVMASGFIADTSSLPFVVVVIFSIGMYVVVWGLHNAQLTDLVKAALVALMDCGLLATTLGTGLISAVLSSIMNNLPTVMFNALAIGSTQAEGVFRDDLRQRHRERSRTQNNADWLARHFAVAACPRTQRRENYVGSKFSHRGCADGANSHHYFARAVPDTDPLKETDKASLLTIGPAGLFFWGREDGCFSKIAFLLE